jgi:hypothetical protein
MRWLSLRPVNYKWPLLNNNNLTGVRFDPARIAKARDVWPFCFVSPIFDGVAERPGAHSQCAGVRAPRVLMPVGLGPNALLRPRTFDCPSLLRVTANGFQRWTLKLRAVEILNPCTRSKSKIRNFIDGEFVEPIPSLSFRAKSRNLWIFLRAAWYDPNAFSYPQLH